MSADAAGYRKKVSSAGSKKRGRKKVKNQSVLICGTALAALIAAVGLSYVAGRVYYGNRFLADTYINGIDVSGKTYDDAVKALKADKIPEELKITTIDKKNIVLSPADFGYKRNAKDEIKKLYDKVNHGTWFSGYAGRTDYTFTDESTYDNDKLKALLDKQDWGSEETKDASLELTDNGYEIKKEVQGNKVTNMDKLDEAVVDALTKGEFEVKLSSGTGCYDVPQITSDTFKDQCEALNKVFNMSITYDFDYTTETITGKTLLSLIDMDDMGNYVVNRDAVEKYVEGLAKKYDTRYATRTFKSTLQGKVKVEPSEDGVYGWWIWQDPTVEQLEHLLEEGKSVESIDPIYVNDGYFEYTGVESARTAKDDIGKTYIEVDLTNQQMWYYKNGKKKYTCYIVSGQTTSAARTTLEGVYKLWSKETNKRMKDRNADGEEWDTTCNYWNNVSLCGIGMHDSTWRGGNFGGTIYQWNGSHGCINMPYEGAQYIYENVPLGTPVVMFYN
ncbi:L,D-transpeptidase family protein [Ruminococcus albus]|uniref:ErfK/YbiS/YcfS/YnhG family protein n=1 Tax=Ruminococcus albus (strain ATCC 27210 / DSM 20455 / JCM 14654 / NCDO 2250 / 7) TaxID=697329 RepID=E6UKF2_RUMA7|nr:L,D-transpeptidase family protein [Ruminococcus albus]ADU24148.1 ErfK/YbiS/YcfS/YnhG family protein [Ruminococcus albus 7 = DSM 20455]